MESKLNYLAVMSVKTTFASSTPCINMIYQADNVLSRFSPAQPVLLFH